MGYWRFNILKGLLLQLRNVFFSTGIVKIMSSAHMNESSIFFTIFQVTAVCV